MSIDRKPARIAVSSFPLMEQPAVAATLASVAGLLNAWSFTHAGTFATVQSGNLVTAGYSLASGDTARAAAAVASILAFGLGAAADAIAIALLSRRRHVYSVAVLVAHAVVLSLVAISMITGWLPVIWGVLIVSFVAGSQGNAFHREHGMLYGNIAVTFVIQSVFSLVAQSVVSPETRRAALSSAGIYGVVLIAFATGGGVGYVAESAIPQGALWVAVAVTVALALAAARERARIPIDPVSPPLLAASSNEA